MGPKMLAIVLGLITSSDQSINMRQRNKKLIENVKIQRWHKAHDVIRGYLILLVQTEYWIWKLKNSTRELKNYNLMSRSKQQKQKESTHTCLRRRSNWLLKINL